MIWKLLPWIARLLFWCALAWMLIDIVLKRRRARIISEGRIEFTPSRLTIWAWPFMIGFMASPAARDLMHSRGNSWDLLILACLGLAALGLLFLFPGTIVVNSDGLEQFYWLRRNKRIQWKDIEEIDSETSSRVNILGADGTKIVHTLFLGDRPRFLLELKQHCGEELPPDFPQEPVESP